MYRNWCYTPSPDADHYVCTKPIGHTGPHVATWGDYHPNFVPGHDAYICEWHSFRDMCKEALNDM